MRAIACTAAILLLAALGCSRIKYSFQPYYPAGATVPIEVVVPHKSAQPITGTVFYRTKRFGAYQPVPMDVRGDRLWAVLPTEDLDPREIEDSWKDLGSVNKIDANTLSNVGPGRHHTRWQRRYEGRCWAGGPS